MILFDMFNRSVDIHGQILRSRIHMRVTDDLKHLSRPCIAGINGVDTSGKSFFAEELRRFLVFQGFDVLLLHLDDFHNPRSIRNQDESPEGYLRYAFDRNKLQALLSEIAAGPVDRTETVLDLDADSFTKDIHVKTTSDTIVLVEGVLLYRPPLQDVFDYRIFLDVTFDEVLRRARQRDVPKYGEAFLDRYIRRYIPAQKLYLDTFRPRERCDLLIDNNDYNRPFVLSDSGINI